MHTSSLSNPLCPSDIMWVPTRENMSSVFVNNKGKDQTSHAPGLLRAPSCYSLREKCHSKLATNEISISS